MATKADEGELVARLRAGDESAFAGLVRDLHPALLRVARLYAPTIELAEEVVQEAWIGVIRGIDRFRGDASLRTWITRIVINRARTVGGREPRHASFAAAADLDEDPYDGAVDPERFLPAGHEWAGWWSSHPPSWDTIPEQRLLDGEVRATIVRALDRLSPAQREVFVLRDVLGWSSDEVCNALEITAVNQRVLLHRARNKVRAELEVHLFGAEHG